MLAIGCDRTGPLDPAETAPSLARHEITHIDDRGGTFEAHATFTRTATTHFVGQGGSLIVKLALHLIVDGTGAQRIVVGTAKGPCSAI